MTIKAKLVASAAAIASLVACSGALAATTFADYGQVSSAYGLTYSNGTLSTIPGGDPTEFSFLVGGLPNNIASTFTLNATPLTNAVTISDPFGNMYDVQALAGSFRYTYSGASPITINGHSYSAGTTLLAGTFSDATLYGVDGGSTASFTNSRILGNAVNFSTGIAGITFGPLGDQSFSYGLNSVLPGFFVSGNNLAAFTATSTGNFAADITIGGAGGGVPEAATWVMMILGVGLVGANMRRRNANLVRA